MVSAVLHHAWWHVCSGVLAWSSVCWMKTVRLIQPAEILIWPKKGQSINCQCLFVLSTMCWPSKMELIWFAVLLWCGMGSAPGVVLSSILRCCNAEHVSASGLVNGQLPCRQMKFFFPWDAPWFVLLCTSDYLLVTCRWFFTVQCSYLDKKEQLLKRGNRFLSQTKNDFSLFFHVFLLLCSCVLKFPLPCLYMFSRWIHWCFFPVLPLWCCEHKQNVIIHRVSAEYCRNNGSVPKA